MDERIPDCCPSRYLGWVAQYCDLNGHLLTEPVMIQSGRRSRAVKAWELAARKALISALNEKLLMPASVAERLVGSFDRDAVHQQAGVWLRDEKGVDRG